MIFKIMSASSTFHGVDYNEKKKEQGVASVIYFENFGYLQERSQISKNDFKDFLKKHSCSNSRVKMPQFHAVLSCEGRKLTHEQLKENALDIMDKLGYKNQPILIYQHSDTKNNHIHIVTSRVDSGGKKINDKFEGIRANKLLNELLSINKKQHCEKAINEASGYRITTTSQFNLLLEKQGYTCKRVGEELVLFKHGHEQGRVSNDQINKQIEKSGNVTINAAQLKEIIEKYKVQYSPDLINYSVSNKPDRSRAFSSQLTDHLHKSLGLEFVFFGNKTHVKPYGYVIIDHKNKAVIKGSEVMNLEMLIGRLPAQWQQKKGQNYRSSAATANLPRQKVEGMLDKEATHATHSFIDEGLMQSLDMIIDDALRENETSGLTAKRKKSKKKNQSY